MRQGSEDARKREKGKVGGKGTYAPASTWRDINRSAAKDKEPDRVERLEMRPKRILAQEDQENQGRLRSQTTSFKPIGWN